MTPSLSTLHPSSDNMPILLPSSEDIPSPSRDRSPGLNPQDYLNEDLTPRPLEEIYADPEVPSAPLTPLPFLESIWNSDMIVKFHDTSGRKSGAVVIVMVSGLIGMQQRLLVMFL